MTGRVASVHRKRCAFTNSRVSWKAPHLAMRCELYFEPAADVTGDYLQVAVQLQTWKERHQAAELEAQARRRCPRQRPQLQKGQRVNKEVRSAAENMSPLPLGSRKDRPTGTCGFLTRWFR